MTDRPKILIVEDETAVAMMVMFLLTRAGCDVSVAPTGKKALELAQESRFDLITLDIDLPGAGGLEICAELKQRHLTRHTPVVFVTGRLGEQDVQRGLEVGAVDYITKPFGVEFAPRLLSHIKSMPNGSDDRGESLTPITKNGESGHAKVSHDIADKVL